METVITLLGIGLVAYGLVWLIAWIDRHKAPAPKREGRGAWEEVKITAGGLAHLGGCLVYLILGLVALFVLVWLVKRMWEAA
jgi:hypothetical protein